MSLNYKLVCKETKESVWIGQGTALMMTSLYTGEEETMERLRRFLVETKGKKLTLVSEHEDVFSKVNEYNKFYCKVCSHSNCFIDKGFCSQTDREITKEELNSQTPPEWCPMKNL